MPSFGRFPERFVVDFLARLQTVPAPPHAQQWGPCRLWVGARTSDGYGHLSWKGQDLMAHAVGYELDRGHPPRNEVLRHRCGNRPCCAGSHLIDGTHAENLADAVKMGTHVPPPHPCGDAHPSAILSNDQIDEVFALREQGFTQQEIADTMGVSQPEISQVLSGKARTCHRRGAR